MKYIHHKNIDADNYKEAIKSNLYNDSEWQIKPGQWVLGFAFFPTTLEDDRTVWLRKVWRRKVVYYIDSYVPEISRQYVDKKLMERIKKMKLKHLEKQMTLELIDFGKHLKNRG